jgi:Fe-S-cluster containining protein
MVFFCRQCGSCCMYMGDYIVIEDQTGPFEFACESVSTGTPFIARVSDNKHQIFLDHTFLDQHPSACRFLRPEGDLVLCVIHETRPCQCRHYRCVVMRIFNSRGCLIGHVTGNLSLHTDDPVLRNEWEAAEQSISRSSDDAEIRLQKYLEDKGYRVE